MSSVRVFAPRFEIDRSSRAAIKGQQPCVLWLTGPSGAGKSTIAGLVERCLHQSGRHTYLLDVDNVRVGINCDLDFSGASCAENLRRVAEIAKLMLDAGLIVIVALTSPFRESRRLARLRFEPGEFIEVQVHASLHDIEARDPQSLYKLARRGRIRNFTGIDSPCKAPEEPEIMIDTASMTPDASAALIVDWLACHGHLSAR